MQPQTVAEPDHIRAAQSHAGVVLVMGEQQFDNYQSKSNLNSLLTFRNFSIFLPLTRHVRTDVQFANVAAAAST